jgi:hypothetical protein
VRAAVPGLTADDLDRLHELELDVGAAAADEDVIAMT